MIWSRLCQGKFLVVLYFDWRTAPTFQRGSYVWYFVSVGNHQLLAGGSSSDAEDIELGPIDQVRRYSVSYILVSAVVLVCENSLRLTISINLQRVRLDRRALWASLRAYFRIHLEIRTRETHSLFYGLFAAILSFCLGARWNSCTAQRSSKKFISFHRTAQNSAYVGLRQTSTWYDRMAAMMKKLRRCKKKFICEDDYRFLCPNCMYIEGPRCGG